MPLTAAAGCISKLEERLALTLAAAAAFQAWVGAADAEEALESIYFGALPPPANDAEEYTADELAGYRPFALVFTDTKGGHRRNFAAGGSRHYSTQSGELMVILEQATDPDAVNDPQEADRLVKNAVGQILDDLDELNGQSGYLAYSEIRFWGPMRTHPDDVPSIGDAQQYHLEIDYGRQGR